MRKAIIGLIYAGIAVIAVIGLVYFGTSSLNPSIMPHPQFQGTLTILGEPDSEEVQYLDSNVVPAGDDFIAIASGSMHQLALHSNGTITCWGNNRYGQCDVPQETEIVAISANRAQSLALRSNGSIICWGANLTENGKEISCIPPDGNDYIAIASGYGQSLALHSDGTVVQWGRNDNGQDIVPAGNNFIAIASGMYHNIALRSDGTIACWGSQDYCDIPSGNDYVAISASDHTSLALRETGEVVSWGYESENGWHYPPPGNDFVAISNGNNAHYAIRSDGSVVCWCGKTVKTCHIGSVNDTIAISTGDEQNIAITNPQSEEILAWKWQEIMARIKSQVGSSSNQNVLNAVYSAEYVINSSVQDAPSSVIAYTVNNPDNITYREGFPPGEFTLTSKNFRLTINDVEKDPYHYVPYREYSAKSLATAIAEFKTHRLSVDETYISNNGPVDEADRIVITKISFAYTARPTASGLYILQPVYIFEGLVEKGSSGSSFERETVPATENLVEFDFLEKEPEATTEQTSSTS